MVKFLLRRGAKINVQNHRGNTCLHYLYEYGKTDLAEYMKGH
jgi:ankyrin repeat protein